MKDDKYESHLRQRFYRFVQIGTVMIMILYIAVAVRLHWDKNNPPQRSMNSVEVKICQLDCPSCQALLKKDGK